MANLDWLPAALVGVGGSIVGGAVGGRYAIRAAREQWDHEREAAREQWEHERETALRDRSHEAARAIMASLGELQQAIVDWQKGRTDATGLRGAHNAFTRAAYVESTALIDEELRNRLENHRFLEYNLDRYAHTLDGIHRQAEAEELAKKVLLLSDTVLGHADRVLQALENHVRDQKLPDYEAPPQVDLLKLLDWGKQQFALKSVKAEDVAPILARVNREGR